MSYNYNNDPLAEAARLYHRKTILDMITRAENGKATEEEVQFIKELYRKLWELVPKLKN